MTAASNAQAPPHLVDPDFEKLLSPISLDVLDQHDATIYGIRRDLTLGYANSYWLQFAADNEGSPELCQADKILGRPVLESMVGPARDFYARLFVQVLNDATPRTHEYDCSSPDVLRNFHMNLLPLPLNTDHARGLLIINSRSIAPHEMPHHDPIQSPCDEYYVNAHDQIVSCSNCECTRRIDNPDQWDWVPSYRDSPPVAVSHGICPVCLDYYYPAPSELDASSSPSG